jgi:hypothetical protein
MDLIEASRSSFEEEQKAFSKLERLESQRGVDSYYALSAWEGRLEDLAAKIEKIKDKLNKNPDEHAEADRKGLLSELQSNMDAVLKRSEEEKNIELEFVPEWIVGRTIAFIANSETHLRSIIKNYNHIFSQNLDQQELAGYQIGYSIDEELKNTRPDCVESVELLAVFKEEGEFCVRAAREYCGPTADRPRQMDLACLGKRLINNSRKKCFEIREVKVPIESLSFDHSPGVSSSVALEETVRITSYKRSTGQITLVGKGFDRGGHSTHDVNIYVKRGGQEFIGQVETQNGSFSYTTPERNEKGVHWNLRRGELIVVKVLGYFGDEKADHYEITKRIPYSHGRDPVERKPKYRIVREKVEASWLKRAIRGCVSDQLIFKD